MKVSQTVGSPATPPGRYNHFLTNCPRFRPSNPTAMRILPLVAGVVLFAAPTAVAAPVDFNKDIRRILADRCYACHGPDEKARKAKLRLDVRDEAVKLGVFVPGKPEASELLKRVSSHDPELQMPPAKSKKPALSAEQVALVK